MEVDRRFPFTTTAGHPLRPGILWGSVQRPYPTGAWWINLALDDGDFPVVPLPYAIKAGQHDVGISYSAMRREVTLTRIEDSFAPDLSISAAEGVTGHQVVG